MKHLSNYGEVPFGQFDTLISTFLIVFLLYKVFFQLIAPEMPIS